VSTKKITTPFSRLIPLAQNSAVIWDQLGWRRSVTVGLRRWIIISTIHLTWGYRQKYRFFPNNGAVSPCRADRLDHWPQERNPFSLTILRL
jgi:hypothetical protein